VVISAPAVILSIVLGWDFTVTVLVLAIPTVVYTMLGGVQAVAWADVKQMVVIVAGVVAAVVVLVVGLPENVGFGSALHLAGASSRLNTIDFTFDVITPYTFWSGLIGGTFLALGYFGCDQSQVQRYLTAKSVNEGRHSLLMSAFFKIPLQTLILLTGVLVFVFYMFNRPPMLFNPAHDATVRSSARGAEYQQLEREFVSAHEARKTSATALVEAQRSGDAARIAAARTALTERNAEVAGVRGRGLSLVREVSGDPTFNDVNYVFPTFVVTRLPIGLVGLMIAAIFAAAMSTIAAELNSLATATVVDFYRRYWRPVASDREYLNASKAATLVWGIFASFVATWAVSLGSLIQVVNQLGSFFYGSLFGVFFLAIVARRATAAGAFWGMLAGMTAVGVVGTTTEVAFLWQNVIGTVVVVVVGLAISYAARLNRAASSA
jgi:Na+/proline symporter